MKMNDFLEEVNGSLTPTEAEVYVSSLPDYVNEVIFNPLYDISKREEKDTLTIGEEGMIIAKMIAGNANDDDSFILNKDSFNRYRWIVNGSDGAIKDKISSLPIQFIVYTRVRQVLYHSCLTTRNFDSLPDIIKSSLSDGSDQFSELELVRILDGDTGIHIHMKSIDSIVNKIMQILYTKEDSTFQKMVRLALADKETGLSIMSIIREANNISVSDEKWLSGFFKETKEPDSLSSFSKKLLEGDMDENMFAIINYLIGLKILVRLRLWN